jgi:hypothetical protein
LNCEVTLCTTREALTEVLQQDDDGFYRLRVFERFVLRVKDKTAIIRLNFE